MGVLRRSKLNESKVESKILLTCTENEVNSFGRFKIIKGKDKDSPCPPFPHFLQVSSKPRVISHSLHQPSQKVAEVGTRVAVRLAGLEKENIQKKKKKKG